jgi:ketosteroid isomerase-like protein
VFAASDDLTSSVSGSTDHVLLAPAEGVQLAAVRAADDERVAAVLAADPARLNAILSDQLRYTHANGKVDTKQSYTEALVSHKTVYETYAYTQRDFHPATADIVLMTGRMMIKAKSTTGSLASEVSILAVWRLEGGHWRFLAWQSAKLTPPAAK